MKWVGYKTCTWEPEENLENCKELLNNFRLSKIEEKVNNKKKNEEKKPKKNKIKMGGTTLYTEKKRISPDIEISDDLDIEPSTTISTSEKNKIKKNGFSKNKKRKIFEKMKPNENIKYEIELKDDDDEEIKEIKDNIKNKVAYLKKKENNTNDIIEETLYINKNNNKNKTPGNEIGYEILRINSMKVPNNPNEGITLNIIVKKNNQIIIDNFNTKTEEIPSDYLAKFYEKFIYENAPGFKYEREMSFDN